MKNLTYFLIRQKLNTFLNNQWVKADIKKKFVKILEKENEHGGTTYQNIWDADKAELSGKFILINTYIKENKRSET